MPNTIDPAISGELSNENRNYLSANTIMRLLPDVAGRNVLLNDIGIISTKKNIYENDKIKEHTPLADAYVSMLKNEMSYGGQSLSAINVFNNTATGADGHWMAGRQIGRHFLIIDGLPSTGASEEKYTYSKNIETKLKEAIPDLNVIVYKSGLQQDGNSCGHWVLFSQLILNAMQENNIDYNPNNIGLSFNLAVNAMAAEKALDNKQRDLVAKAVFEDIDSGRAAEIQAKLAGIYALELSKKKEQQKALEPEKKYKPEKKARFQLPLEHKTKVIKQVDTITQQKQIQQQNRALAEKARNGANTLRQQAERKQARTPAAIRASILAQATEKKQINNIKQLIQDRVQDAAIAQALDNIEKGVNTPEPYPKQIRNNSATLISTDEKLASIVQSDEDEISARKLQEAEYRKFAKQIDRKENIPYRGR